jgi:hypothetical protein
MYGADSKLRAEKVGSAYVAGKAATSCPKGQKKTTQIRGSPITTKKYSEYQHCTAPVLQLNCYFVSLLLRFSHEAANKVGK